jgi:hypothetical protein
MMRQTKRTSAVPSDRAFAPDRIALLRIVRPDGTDEVGKMMRQIKRRARFHPIGRLRLIGSRSCASSDLTEPVRSAR